MHTVCRVHDSSSLTPDLNCNQDASLLSLLDSLMHAAHEERALSCTLYPGSVPDLRVFVIIPAWHI